MVPRISDAEWQVMQVVWRLGQCSAQDVIAALGETEWSDATVKTLLNRLLKKEALAFEKSGKSYLYSALVSEDECQRAETETFVQRVFGGSVVPMMAHFVQSKKLSQREVAELRKLLGDKGK
jgi:BlaI family penicillinase repressor